MPACSRIFDFAPSAPTSSRAEIVSPPASCTSICIRRVLEAADRIRPQIDAELLCLLDQRVDQVAVLDHVREGLAFLHVAAESEEGRAHRVVEF